MREGLSGLARELDPWQLTLGDAKAMLGEVVAVKNTAATLEGRLARRIAEAGEWERAGFPTPEAWLARQTGSPLGRAREALQTAQRLEQLPAVAEAANAGVLSADQVAVIADAATADPTAEQRLVESAKTKPLSNLRDECAATKRAADPDPEAAHRSLRGVDQRQAPPATAGAAGLPGTTAATTTTSRPTRAGPSSATPTAPSTWSDPPTPDTPTAPVASTIRTAPTRHDPEPAATPPPPCSSAQTASKRST
jgi:hypothetical protein